MSSTRRGASELNWSPKFKGSGRRSGGSQSETAAAASRAMGHIKAIEIRQQNGHGVDEAYLEKVSQTLNPKASKRNGASATPRRLGLPKGWPIAVGLAAAGCAVWLLLSAVGGKAHSVSGTLLLTRRPVAKAAVVFHPTRSGGEPTRTITGDDGSFRIGGLSPDAYKVTIEPGDAGTSTIPPAYRNATTTPFTLNVYKDLERVRMYAMNTPPRINPSAAVSPSAYD